MDITRFTEDRQDVFWIVGAGQAERHATTMRPGAVYAGQCVAALCDVQIKIPQPTPLGRDPLTKKVTRKCPACEGIAEVKNYAETSWDF